MSQSPHYNEVISAIEAYIFGCMRADADAVSAAFSPDAFMWGYLGNEYVSQSGEDFARTVIAHAKPAGDEYTYNIHTVQVTGDVANATIDEQNFLGANFINYFGLVRRNGTWRIASKVFTTV